MENPNIHKRTRCSMTAITRTFTLLTLLIIVLLIMANCAPSISQEEYDSMKSELSDARNQLAELQEKLTAAEAVEAQYPNSSTQYEELQKQHDALVDEIQSIQSEFDGLNAKYDDLKIQDDARINEMHAIQSEYDELQRQYDIVVEGTAVFSEEEINQAIFELINQERKNNGVNELEWGINLDNMVLSNSRQMAEKGEYQYSTGGAMWQEVFWATKYGTIDQLANAALTIWKVDSYRYENNIINPQSVYGAVGTYKLGEIYYITYMASIFR